MPETHGIVEIDPLDKHTGLLLHGVLQRIQDYSEQTYPEYIAEQTAREILVAATAQDGTFLLLGLVEVSTGKLVGHAVAQYKGPISEGEVGTPWVNVVQVRADQAAGPGANRELTRAIYDWGKLRQVDRYLMTTKNVEAAWLKKDGWKVLRHTMIREGTDSD